MFLGFTVWRCSWFTSLFKSVGETLGRIAYRGIYIQTLGRYRRREFQLADNTFSLTSQIGLVVRSVIYIAVATLYVPTCASYA